MHPSSLPKIVQVCILHMLCDAVCIYAVTLIALICSQAMKLEMIHKFADQIMNSETFGC